MEWLSVCSHFHKTQQLVAQFPELTSVFETHRAAAHALLCEVVGGLLKQSATALRAQPTTSSKSCPLGGVEHGIDEGPKRIPQLFR